MRAHKAALIGVSAFVFANFFSSSLKAQGIENSAPKSSLTAFLPDTGMMKAKKVKILRAMPLSELDGVKNGPVKGSNLIGWFLENGNKLTISMKKLKEWRGIGGYDDKWKSDEDTLESSIAFPGKKTHVLMTRNPAGFDMFFLAMDDSVGKDIKALMVIDKITEQNIVMSGNVISWVGEKGTLNKKPTGMLTDDDDKKKEAPKYELRVMLFEEKIIVSVAFDKKPDKDAQISINGNGIVLSKGKKVYASLSLEQLATELDKGEVPEGLRLNKLNEIYTIPQEWVKVQ